MFRVIITAISIFSSFPVFAQEGQCEAGRGVDDGFQYIIVTYNGDEVILKHPIRNAVSIYKYKGGTLRTDGGSVEVLEKGIKVGLNKMITTIPVKGICRNATSANIPTGR